ncbi:MAG: DUF2330 domain-containing protein [Geminocystis sp.]|nr:DUF2330 domain-containing protein [Geminocystis sp.]MCS7147267.1 DUF2330 domain-containing protein [Geminocystis sp.]MDW8116266.1 DUF2330 domain-containing protein [Geminocystis sp.]MDW8462743.1 DUF2330 domain-containing protein [Geminocystis sp.]
MKKILLTVAILLAVCLSFPQQVWAFCGFYVAKADTKLYNQASQVIIARKGDRTVLTMANDYQGDVKDFAVVVPIPVSVTKDQVNVGNPKILERLDAFSAPRLVEYYDYDPCAPPLPIYRTQQEAPNVAGGGRRGAMSDQALGVTVESKFTVGEYDIVVLSAKESQGLETWLIQNGYKIPRGAKELLAPYIRQKMKFFVARVNLEEYEKGGYVNLRPLQVAYEYPKFMLPIRLGMINSKKEQDLIIYLLSDTGQTELTNYRTVKIPSNVDVPEFVEKQFGDFYKAMFTRSYEREGKRVAFLEYAWNMGWCDPCAAEPLTPDELRQAGVFWYDPNRPSDVFITRLHVRYDRAHFPEDLRFQNTPNQELFQGRYVIRHPFRGPISCEAGKDYLRKTRQRQEKEAQTLAILTGWDINKIRRQIDFVNVHVKIEETPWWRRLWPERNR